jgi:lipopolysaccharide/colanic/teichoic acid biosynthesis glycosyltransferase
MNDQNLVSPATRRLHATFARLSWLWHTRLPAVLKRGLDILVSGALLLLCLPLFAVLGLLIKLQDGGPVLFWQQRVGRDGALFPFPKLRSMYVDAEARRAAVLASNQHGKDGITFKMRRDPRITPVGRLIRRSGLVGPRPALPVEVARYGLEERARLHAVPGLTGIWQVSGRSELPFETQVLMDLEYIRHPSLAADLLLLAKTVPAVIVGRGAY